MSQPRLLIDASAGFNQGAGIGRYSRSLLQAALPDLANDFDLRIWYACDSKHAAPFEEQAIGAIPESLRSRVKRSRWSRRRMDQFARLPIEIPTRFFTGAAEVAYSPDFTIPGVFSGAGMITVHDLAFEMIPESYPAGLLNYLRTVVPTNVRRSELVAVVSRTTRIDVVERYNVSPDRVVVIPNAADERFYSSTPLSDLRSQELRIPDDYLLAVGTIEPRKNYLTLLTAQQRAFPQTRRPLVVVGRTGWHNRHEMALLRQLADQNAVIPLIDAADEDLPGLYAGARAVVYVPLYEGFGLPVLEALAAGTPVITSDIPSVREVAAGHTTIVPPRDIDTLVDALRSISTLTSTDPATLKSAARKYSWHESGSILRDTLSNLAKRVRP
jgi:glycosyltransferase involved in cell wall biosynthesis